MLGRPGRGCCAGRSGNPGRFPDFHGLILAGRSDEPAIGTQGHFFDRAGVSAEGVNRAGGLLPDFDRRIQPAPNQPLSVRAERHTLDATPRVAELMAELPGLDVTYSVPA